MKYKKVRVECCYNLGGDYISFTHNPLHGQTFENVDVNFDKITFTIGDTSYVADAVAIEGQETIECELLAHYTNPDGTLIIKICQDWG